MIRNSESIEPAAIVAAGSFFEDACAEDVPVLDAVPVDDGALDLVSIRQLTGKKVWEGCSSGRSGGGGADGRSEGVRSSGAGRSSSGHNAGGRSSNGSSGSAGGSEGAFRKIGRVSAFAFHPIEKKCVGFLVKRPDMALMFHRKDLFVSFDGFDILDGHIVAGSASGAKGKSAQKAIGVDLEDCVIWLGLPVVCEDGTMLGTVGDVLCELESGRVYSLEISKGAATNALLGTLQVFVDEIVGFCFCSAADGAAGASSVGRASASGDRFPAIAVKDVVKARPVEGGVAEKAGTATAVIAHNAKQAVEKVKPKAKEAGTAAGEAVNKGAYIAGRQIGRTKGMFSAFKEEFDKALHDEDVDEGEER